MFFEVAVMFFEVLAGNFQRNFKLLHVL